MNRVLLAGRLARDMKQSARSDTVFFGTVAANTGQDQEGDTRVGFIPFTAFNLSEDQQRLLARGVEVVIEGQIEVCVKAGGIRRRREVSDEEWAEIAEQTDTP